MAVQSSFKNMSLCLLVICLVCSALLAGVYALTKEPIDAAAKAKNEAAIKEVLPDVAVTIEEERTVDFEGATYTYNLAYDELGNTVGCAINVAPSGFGGPISIKVGFDINGVIWNTKVLSQAETPGLGAKCVEPAFSDQFKGFDPAQKTLAVKKDGGDVDAITASTITSRAYAEGLALAAKVFDAIAQTPMPLEADVEDSAEVSGSDPVIPSEVEESIK
ncbi:MAG: RnfABCDGE type electron transport complex subunit G [Bacteroidales bacterium]|nr:RnfABCDGE type electron transport complex subunit G [Bacteroidales bacterium]